MGARPIAPREEAATGKSIRIAATLVGVVDALVWLCLVAIYLLSQADPATQRLDEAAGGAATVLFMLTGAPALVLAWRGRGLVTALILGLAFPAAFLALLLTAIHAIL